MGSAGSVLSGRIYEDIKNPQRLSERTESWRRSSALKSQGEMAAWRIGWIHFKAGQWQKAFDQFKDNLDQSPKGNLTDKNLFWMAKAAEKLDKASEAQILFKDLAHRFPYTYYGLEAINHLDEAFPNPCKTPSPFRKASYKKERSFTQPGRRLSAREKFHFKRASELIELGDFTQARIELLRMGRSIRKNLSGVMWLSHWYNRAQAYADSLQILQLFKNFKTIHGEKELPRQFWINFYPSAYSEYVKTEARKIRSGPLVGERPDSAGKHVQHEVPVTRRGAGSDADHAQDRQTSVRTGPIRTKPLTRISCSNRISTSAWASGI